MFDKQFEFLASLKKKQKIISDAFLVGSTTYLEEPSDIDVILICNKPDHDKAIKLVAKTVLSMSSTSSYRLVDDAVRVYFPGSIDLSLAIYPREPFEKKLRDLYQGNIESITATHRPWAIGGWLPEGLMAELLAAKPIFENKYLPSLQDRFHAYPPLMRNAIIRTCDEEIHFKEKKELSPEDQWMESIKQQEIRLAKIRRSFADNKVYLCGYRRVLQQAEKSRNTQVVREVKAILSSSKLILGQ